MTRLQQVEEIGSGHRPANQLIFVDMRIAPLIFHTSRRIWTLKLKFENDTTMLAKDDMAHAAFRR
jgi:hypothetical protein